MNMGDDTAFAGAKLALFLGGHLAVILRDDTIGLPFANQWDFPGGGREGCEDAWTCARRECQEELGLHVPDSAVRWSRAFCEGTRIKWFFVADLPASAVDDIVFGNEGQRWALMTAQEFLEHPRAIKPFQERLRLYLEEVCGESPPPS